MSGTMNADLFPEARTEDPNRRYTTREFMEWIKAKADVDAWDLDAAAGADNAKCRRFFTVRTSALARPWTSRCFWCNPPYGCEPGTGTWVEYSRHQVEAGHAKSGCLLIPVKAETAWYQDAVWGECRVIASRKVTDGPLATKTETGFFANALVFFNPGPKPALLEVSP